MPSMRRCLIRCSPRSPSSPSLSRPPRIGARPSTTSIHYICPTTPTAAGIDCFLDAVPHTYTMCRHVKSIEIIEFGYDRRAGRRQRRQDRVLHRQAQASDHAALPGGVARSRARQARRCEGLRKPVRRPGSTALPSSTPEPDEIDADYKQRVTQSVRRRSTSRSRRIRDDRRRSAKPPSRHTEAGDAKKKAAPAATHAKPQAMPRAPRGRRAREADAERHRARARSSAPDGTLARNAPGFRSRPQQLAMAEAIAHAIDDARPAGRRSRHRHRQDLRLSRSGAALRRQGHRLDRHQDAAGPALRARPAAGARRARSRRSPSRCSRAAPTTSATIISSATAARGRRCRRAPTSRYLQRIESRSRARRERGDRGELADVPENAAIWPIVTSTRDNCLGSECAHYDECFVMKARKQALAADVVVVNHHLFFADVMLRDEGLAELLPACNTVILDEAHQLPDTATLFFGEADHRRAARRARARRRSSKALKAARDYAPLPDAAQALVPALRKFRLAAGDAPGKLPRSDALRRAGFRRSARRARRGARRAVAAELGTQAERSDDLAQCRAARRRRRRRGSRAGGDPATIREWIRWIDVSAPGLATARVAAVGRRHVRQAGRRDRRAPGSSPRRRSRSAATSRSTSASWASATPRPATGRARSTTPTQALLYVPRGSARSRTASSTPTRSSTRRCRC